MLPLYKNALDSRLRGSPIYLERLLSLWQSDQQTGLIEIQVTPERQLLLLYAQGRQVGAFRLFSAGSVKLEPFELTQGWEKPEAEVRLVNTPLTAVRLARQALEWLPVQEKTVLPTTELTSVLHTLRQEKQNRLLRLICPEADGFLLIYQGQPILAESLFATDRGFENLPAFLRTPLLGSSLGVPAVTPPGLIELQFHPVLRDNLPYSLLLLRHAFTLWMEKLLQSYRQQVGVALLKGLINEINPLLQLKNWHFTFQETRFHEEHYFLQPGEMAFAYRLLLYILMDQMNRVLGSQQIDQMLKEGFQSLDVTLQKVLQGQNLTPLGLRKREGT